MFAFWRSPLKALQGCAADTGSMRIRGVVMEGGEGGGQGGDVKQMWCCLGDLNHFQVHPSSDFTCTPYFRSLPESQSRAQSLSLGAEHNHPHNTIRSAQFTGVVSISSRPPTHPADAWVLTPGS